MGSRKDRNSKSVITSAISVNGNNAIWSQACQRPTRTIYFNKLFSVFLFSIFLIVFLFSVFSSPGLSQSKRIYLNEGWHFRRVGDTVWYPATVPGTVHTDLLANGLIPDPFFGDNEKQLQWIENETWEYSLDFNLDSNRATDEYASIVFEGIDTYAIVFLNNEPIGLPLHNHFDNMFVSKDYNTYNYPFELQKNNNNLTIIFHPAKTISDSLSMEFYKKNGIKELPGGNQVFTRKAPYHFGWDWGPRFVTAGIWKNIYVETKPIGSINNIRTSIVKLNSDKAIINFFLTTRVDVSFHNDSDYLLVITELNEDKVYLTEKISPLPIRNMSFVSYSSPYRIEIKDPQLWWCNGTGEPHLYKFKFTTKRENRTFDEKVINIGLRKIEHIQEKDEYGESFYFNLNGKPVFIKGANYVPPDVFLPRFSKEQYRELLVNAKNSNINMLRVWGGGVYADDYFYDLCDSLGIMVWQDFMFACAMYPGDERFINSVKLEVKDNFQRLQNHPCIALWCGNNEIDEGWKYWG
ncbi:MAG: hypothetical protein MUE56_00180 [Ignavibacteria bacterium]|nr:hypothetical protein [Ignavibacteria bacterium]